MKKSTELRQELDGLVTSQEALMNKAKEEKRSLNADEGTKFDDLQKEIDEKRAEVRRAEQMEESLRQRAEKGEGESQMRGRRSTGGEQGEYEGLKKRFSLYKAIRSQLPNQKLDGVELEVHQETSKRAKASNIDIQGVAVPMDFRSNGAEKRFAGQSVGEDSGGYGGALVGEELQPVIEFLRPKPILESLGATYLTGLTGNVRFPVNDGGIAASWEGEVDAIDDSKNAYSSKEMSPKRLGASVPISLQNLAQSSIDLENYTMQEMMSVIANAIDTAAINGSGTSGVPLGILGTSGIGSVVGGTNGAAPTWAQIVGLETSVFVNNANAAKMAYLINTVTKGKLKTTKHEAGDLGYLMAMDNTINGYNVGVSNLVPSNLTKGTASGVCSAGIFGDFSQLLIGQWAFMDLTVDNISKKKSGYIEVIANTFLDILVRQPKAFAAIKDWLTT